MKQVLDERTVSAHARVRGLVVQSVQHRRHHGGLEGRAVAVAPHGLGIHRGDTLGQGRTFDHVHGVQRVVGAMDFEARDLAAEFAGHAQERLMLVGTQRLRLAWPSGTGMAVAGRRAAAGLPALQRSRRDAAAFALVRFNALRGANTLSPDGAVAEAGYSAWPWPLLETTNSLIRRRSCPRCCGGAPAFPEATSACVALRSHCCICCGYTPCTQDRTLRTASSIDVPSGSDNLAATRSLNVYPCRATPLPHRSPPIIGSYLGNNYPDAGIHWALPSPAKVDYLRQVELKYRSNIRSPLPG